MKGSVNSKIARMLLPGLKRWIAIILAGILVMVVGIFLFLGYHPVHVTTMMLSESLDYAAKLLPHKISGIAVIVGGALIVFIAIAKMTLSVVGAYLPDDRESIPDVLYRKRHLSKGTRVVVIGGGTGLSNLLRGIKSFTNNITAIVTVGDDGGSSGRLRQELGVLPPGDIRNCITALADEERLVTELFRYRFQSGAGLEGHSFGNLFLSALCAITNGDMLEATRVASRVLNSCGQVLPSTVTNFSLVAELTDGRIIEGESQIPLAAGRIKSLTLKPALPKAVPEAIEAIYNADLIILGPGSLYTSIIPNLLVDGIAQAIRDSSADKIYVSNVLTQNGETNNYSVADHVEALLVHSGTPLNLGYRLMETVLVNDQLPTLQSEAQPVKFDADRLRDLGVVPLKRSLLNAQSIGHHDSEKLAKTIMLWHMRHGRKAPLKQTIRAASSASKNGKFSAGAKATAPNDSLAEINELSELNELSKLNEMSELNAMEAVETIEKPAEIVS